MSQTESDRWPAVVPGIEGATMRSWTGLAGRLAVAVLPFLALAVYMAPPVDGYSIVYADWAQYLLHARALAEGRGYADIEYIFTPYNPFIGPQAFPPGTAVSLVPLFLLFGDPRLAIQVLMLLFALAWLWLAGRYFASHTSAWVAIAVVLLSGLSADTLRSATRVGSDLPFCAALWAVMVVADRKGPWSPGRIVAICALGAAAISYRAIGIVLVPGILLYGAISFREKKLTPLIPAAVWTATFFMVTRMLPVSRAYMAQLPAEDAPGLLPVSLFNLYRYRLAVAEAHLYPFPWDLANDGYHLLTVGLSVVGAVAWLARGWRRLVTCVSLFYLGVLMIYVDAVTRYLWPLFPLLVALLVMGADRTLGWATSLDTAGRRRVLAVLGCLLIVGASLHVATLPGQATFQNSPEYLEAIRQLEAVAAAGAVEPRVVVTKPQPFAWLTGFPAMGHFATTPEATVRELCDNGITHVITGSLVAQDVVASASIRDIVTSMPDRFRLVWEGQTLRLWTHDLTRCPAPGAAGSDAAGRNG